MRFILFVLAVLVGVAVARNTERTKAFKAWEDLKCQDGTTIGAISLRTKTDKATGCCDVRPKLFCKKFAKGNAIGECKEMEKDFNLKGQCSETAAAEEAAAARRRRQKRETDEPKDNATRAEDKEELTFGADQGCGFGYALAGFASDKYEKDTCSRRIKLYCCKVENAEIDDEGIGCTLGAADPKKTSGKNKAPMVSDPVKASNACPRDIASGVQIQEDGKWTVKFCPVKEDGEEYDPECEKINEEQTKVTELTGYNEVVETETNEEGEVTEITNQEEVQKDEEEVKKEIEAAGGKEAFEEEKQERIEEEVETTEETTTTTTEEGEEEGKEEETKDVATEETAAEETEEMEEAEPGESCLCTCSKQCGGEPAEEGKSSGSGKKKGHRGRGRKGHGRNGKRRGSRHQRNKRDTRTRKTVRRTTTITKTTTTTKKMVTFKTMMYQGKKCILVIPEEEEVKKCPEDECKCDNICPEDEEESCDDGAAEGEEETTPAPDDATTTGATTEASSDQEKQTEDEQRAAWLRRLRRLQALRNRN